ncbi:MAG: EAL domain-containing protein [Aromatoleum sp.]|jgi:diguanylate cyclase (GGDEF)-like protein/PAS domain S-box-containing protein|uniref:EAL domain-containing protein n=1 Tax=Aromatoleum sp. TaxID=2307007 RepID=UPI00289554BF|nr:EAL domain-containing protein [Aromatoleum sp.]MDT3672477.1 EAL domain-containing protein [Aromatoleum sp.]
MNDDNASAPLAAACERAARYCAFATVALGFAVLAGWAFDIRVLKTLLPPWVAMKPNTAVAFILAGISLGAAGKSADSGAWRAASRLSAATLLLLVLLTLAQYVFSVDFGIDRMLFDAPFEPRSGGGPDGRMAAATAVAFVFFGAALLMLDLPRLRFAPQAAALGGGLIGVLAILGYAYDVYALYGLGLYSTVAFPTAIGLVLLHLGVFFVRPRSGMMVTVISDTLGGMMARRLLPVAFIAPFLIGWGRVLGERLGYYESDFGVALVSVVYVALFGAFIWRTADVLRESEMRRAATERVRREQQAQLTGIIDSAMDAIVMIDGEHHIVLFNPAAERMFGHRAPDVLDKPLDVLLPERFRSGHPEHLQAFEASGSPSRHIPGLGSMTGLRANGEEFPIEASIAHLATNGRKFFTVILRDVTDQRRIETDLRVAAAAFEAHVGIVVCDPNNVILRINRTFTEETGYTAAEVVGHTPRILKSGQHDAAFYAAMWESVARTGVWRGEIWDRRKNGQIYPKWLTITAVKGDDGAVTHYVGTQTDISDRKAAEEEIRYFAFYDPLTHLPNRRLLLDRLHQSHAASARTGRRSALLFIDLDNFKSLNDTLGHNKGDLLLQLVAGRLLECVREGDTVARLGGDEFVVMLDNLSEALSEAAGQAEVVAEKIRAALGEPYALGGRDHRSTPSIGVTLFGSEHVSIDSLLQQADLAMYQAKGAGRNAVRFFDPAMQAAVAAHVALETDLRDALREGQFVLHFQAQVDDGGILTGAEALVRWEHPERGLVFPNEFIPLCEETGLILPLGRWVLERACIQLGAWASQRKTADLTLAVNVSAKQLRQVDFVEQVLTIIGRTGADPTKLKLELTESQLMSDVEDTIAKMTRLKAHGVSFALDDFGTGYSSLSYLKRLLPDKLKIDRSFVRDVLTDPNDAAIAKTVVALARSLGLNVIAEGVESEAQRVFLEGIGCHAYQGYLFSEPVPLEEFERLLGRSDDVTVISAKSGFAHDA